MKNLGITARFPALQTLASVGRSPIKDARTLKSFLTLLAVVIGVIPAIVPPALADTSASSQAAPVIVELFTSEGCSSCPPADKLAIKLQSQAKNGGPIIILSEHVDYWNHLGWRDPYSAPAYTERQHLYAKALGINSVFTPEVVVDGSLSAVGNDSWEVGKAIERCNANPKARVDLVIDNKAAPGPNRKVTINTTCPSSLRGRQVQLFLAITEDGLSSDVKTGENEGVVLAHTGVVRSLQKIGQLVSLDSNRPLSTTAQIELDPNWKKTNLRVVAFYQDPVRQTIVGATQKGLQ